MVRFF